MHICRTLLALLQSLIDVSVSLDVCRQTLSFSAVTLLVGSSDS